MTGLTSDPTGTTKVRGQGRRCPHPTEDVDDLAKVTDQGGGTLSGAGHGGRVLAQFALTPNASTPHRPPHGSHQVVPPSSVRSQRSLPRATTRGARDFRRAMKHDDGRDTVRHAPFHPAASGARSEQGGDALRPNVSVPAHSYTVARDVKDGQRAPIGAFPVRHGSRGVTFAAIVTATGGSDGTPGKGRPSAKGVHQRRGGEGPPGEEGVGARVSRQGARKRPGRHRGERGQGRGKGSGTVRDASIDLQATSGPHRSLTRPRAS
jgi:hypothetical protein